MFEGVAIVPTHDQKNDAPANPGGSIAALQCRWRSAEKNREDPAIFRAIRGLSVFLVLRVVCTSASALLKSPRSPPFFGPARIHSLSIRNGLKQASRDRVNFDRRAGREQTVAAPNRRFGASRN